MGCTECAQRNFLRDRVIVARKGREAVLSFTMTPLAGTPSESWWQDVFDAHFTCVNTDIVPVAQAQQPESSTRLALLVQAT